MNQGGVCGSGRGEGYVDQGVGGGGSVSGSGREGA